MAKDVLDTTTELSVELTKKGVKGSAKSRAIAAFDRFGGNLVELANVRIESDTSKKRAIIEGEAKIIAAQADRIVSEIHSGTLGDNEKRALRQHFTGVLKERKSLDSVLGYALEELKIRPHESDDGPEKLEPKFEDRFEFYAKQASTDELRKRWGKVLASEIREPGAFSNAAMRVIDEISPEAAVVFDKLIEHDIFGCIPSHFINLPADDIYLISQYGLIIHDGFTKQVNAEILNLYDKPYKVFFFNKIAIGYEIEKWNIFILKIKIQKEKFIKQGINDLYIDVYKLTDVGKAIASLDQSISNKNGLKIKSYFDSIYPDAKLFKYDKVKQKWDFWLHQAP